MKVGMVDEHRGVWPIRMMCAVLGLSANGYYAWRARPENSRAAANRTLLNDIRDIHATAAGRTARRACTPSYAATAAELDGPGSSGSCAEQAFVAWLLCRNDRGQLAASMAILSPRTGSAAPSRPRPPARSG